MDQPYLHAVPVHPVPDRAAAVFHEEIDRALGATAASDSAAAGAPMISLDRVIEIARKERPNEAITFASPDDDDPVWQVGVAPAINSPKINAVMTIDGHTGHILRVGDSTRSAAIKFITDLHTDLFLDEKGVLFLGVIGLCFVAAIVSGVVVYGRSCGGWISARCAHAAGGFTGSTCTIWPASSSPPGCWWSV